MTGGRRTNPSFVEHSATDHAPGGVLCGSVGYTQQGNSASADANADRRNSPLLSLTSPADQLGGVRSVGASGRSGLPFSNVGSLGAPELLILVVLAGFLFATFYGAYRAFKNGDIPWLIGILVSWLVGLGWLVGIIYLVAVDGRRRRTA